MFSRLFISYFLFLISNLSIGQSTDRHLVYLLSGQGSDERIFTELDWDSAKYEFQYLDYLVPHRGEQMPEFAARMAKNVDTNRVYSIVGVSLGGMIAMEMDDMLNPSTTIIISSAKCRSELPLRYRIQRYIPLYALVPKGLIKVGAQIAQPIVEPDRKSHKAIFKSMLKSKDKTFMKRSIRMIVNWQGENCDGNVLHIHGDNDHTLPISKIARAEIVNDGSHMMTLTRAETVSKIINNHLDTSTLD